MLTPYQVKLAVTLRPIWHNDPPWIKIGIDNKLSDMILTETTTIDFNIDKYAVADSRLIIEFTNKTNQDTVPGQNIDKAVIIESINFFGITDPRFVWSGIYEPKYPEPWATEQRELGVVLKQQLTNIDYLGFNGKWTLTFYSPFYQWIQWQLVR
jgi:hypothetical protein